MYSADEGSDARKESLTADDVAGICAVYPPDGNRAVDPSVSPGGTLTAGSCDPTPRHGFTTQCPPGGPPKGGGCAASAGGAGSAGAATPALLLGLLAGGVTRRRRRKR